MVVKCQAQIGITKVSFHNSDIIRDDEWPHKWEQPIITYRLNNYTKDIKKRKLQERAVTVAFRTWQLRVKDIKFKRIYDSFEKPDINIDFRPLSSFDNRKGVLAHAVYPGQGEASGDIEINDEWNWTAYSKGMALSTPPLVPVLIHEIGHSLGLKHDTTDMKSIMYPSFDLGRVKNDLHKNDIHRIQLKYGKRGLSQRLLDYFDRRLDMGYDFD